MSDYINMILEEIHVEFTELTTEDADFYSELSEEEFIELFPPIQE